MIGAALLVATARSTPVVVLLVIGAVLLGALLGVVPAALLGMVLGYVRRPRLPRRGDFALAPPLPAPPRTAGTGRPGTHEPPRVASAAQPASGMPEPRPAMAPQSEQRSRLYDAEYEQQVLRVTRLRQTISAQLAVPPEPPDDTEPDA
jgi:hypothetical protein